MSQYIHDGSKTAGAEDAFITVDIARFMPGRGLILISIDATPEKAGSIHLVRKGKDEQRRSLKTGRVVRVGPNALAKDGRWISWSIPLGCDVIVDAYAGHDLADLNGDYYIVADESAILAVVEEGIEYITEAIA